MTDCPFDTLIFDLDGTLVETAPDLCNALNHSLDAAGAAPVALDQMRALVGDGARAMLRRALAAQGRGHGDGELARWMPVFLDHYRANIAVESRPFARCADLLRRFRDAGMALGVCTNKPTDLSRVLLRALALEGFFGSIVGGDTAPARKPDAAHIRAVLAELGRPAAGAAMIGDSRNDVLAARAAGIPVVLVSFGYTPVPARELGADAVIDDFDALPAALRGLA